MGNAECVCGHARELHEHYRRGTDCAVCGPTTCPAFRTRRERGPRPPGLHEVTAPAENDPPAAGD